MNEALQQAVSDFNSYLAGERAPALVGPSLNKIMRAEVRIIAAMVFEWSSRQETGSLVDSIVKARSKVFDIFFYHIVKGELIHKFFPVFEAALIAECPPPVRPQLATHFRDHPWQQIRPLGQMNRHPALMAVANRTAIEVRDDQFNENVYKNVTHNLLSVENRYEISDAQTGTLMAAHTAKVKSLFQDFTGLVQDKQARQEIVIANEADKDSAYETKWNFNLEDYLLQSLDLGIALFNDDYLLQSVRMMELTTELAREKSFDLKASPRFQAKHAAFSLQKIEEYTTRRTSRILVRFLLEWFKDWQPAPLLRRLQVEPNRRVRRVILGVLECYGTTVFSQLQSELNECSAETPWYFIRNLVYLLGRIVVSDSKTRQQAALLIDAQLQPQAKRQANLQCITALASLGTEFAAGRLVEKLALFQRSKDPHAPEIANRIAAALLGFDSSLALEPAIDHALDNWSDEFAERVGKANPPPQMISRLVDIIRHEVRTMRLTFSLLGDTEAALNLLKAVSVHPTPAVLKLCREIQGGLPPRNPLQAAAAAILEREASPPPPVLAADRLLQELAEEKNVAEMICYIREAGLSGCLLVRTTEPLDGAMEFERGELRRAGVNTLFMDAETSFLWLFLLDSRDVARASFGTPDGRTGYLSAVPARTDTTRLIRDALLQKGEVQQIIGTSLLPESRFSQRQVASYFLQFKGAESPAKCRRVWEALAGEPDITALQKVTKLGKHDLYKILFFLLRHDMIAVDVSRKSPGATAMQDGFAMLEVYLQRIARKPVIFNAYRSAAETCESIAKSSTDEVVIFALGVLQNYFGNAFSGRRVFQAANLDICTRVMELVADHVAHQSAESRQALLSHIQFAFQEQDEALQAPPPEPAPTVLQKIENIEAANDAFDTGIDRLLGDEAVDDLMDALDAAMDALGGGAPAAGAPAAARDKGLTAAEQTMLMDLYDNIAAAYVKPLKDFIREIQLNQKIRRSTPLEWVEMVEPSIQLLIGSAEKMGALPIRDVLAELRLVLHGPSRTADQHMFSGAALTAILAAYARLAKLLPKTFALDLTAGDLSSKKEVLITKFILKQVPALTDKQLNRIMLAGLSTFDKFMHSSPDEIAAVTGIPGPLSEEVFMKFYQYRHLYYRHNDEDYRETFLNMFEVNLNILREIHAEIEALTGGPEKGQAERQVRREALVQDRQRVLWSLFILLCVKEEYDLMEAVQQEVFDGRIQRLEDYRSRLAEAV